MMAKIPSQLVVPLSVLFKRGGMGATDVARYAAVSAAEDAQNKIVFAKGGHVVSIGCASERVC